jgi:L-lactate dehydrogenase (cytochrome)
LSTASALPAVFDAVGARTEVWMDGGMRSGQDVRKAVPKDARGTLIGRAILVGLGAMGEAGVMRCLEIIHKELDVSMALRGRTNVRSVGLDTLAAQASPN